MRPEFSAIAAAAVAVSVRTIVQVGGVQRATAVSTVEAASMPDLKDGTGCKILGNSSPPLSSSSSLFTFNISLQQTVKHNPTVSNIFCKMPQKHTNISLFDCITC
jgi:hypothetical protein